MKKNSFVLGVLPATVIVVLIVFYKLIGTASPLLGTLVKLIFFAIVILIVIGVIVDQIRSRQAAFTGTVVKMEFIQQIQSLRLYIDVNGKTIQYVTSQVPRTVKVGDVVSKTSGSKEVLIVTATAATSPPDPTVSPVTPSVATVPEVVSGQSASVTTQDVPPPGVTPQ